MVMETNGLCILPTITNAQLRSNMACFENHYSALHLISNLLDNTPIIKSSDILRFIHSTQLVATQLSGG